MSLRLVPPLPAGTPDDPGLTGPGSVTWRVSRERVVPLGGLSALLLQLAHPLVAAGVAEHSSFRADPTKRLMLTLEMLLVTTFGDIRQVDEMTGRIANIHRVVNGSLQQDVGEWHRGAHYSATSPELCLWVYATIIETTLNSYSTFVRPLDMNERAELYRESERFGQLYGVGQDIRPVSYQEFRDYYARMLSRLTAGDQARLLARMILRARLRGFPIPPWGYLLAAGAAARAAEGAVRLALVRGPASAVVDVHADRPRRDGPAGSGPAPVLGPLSRGHGALPSRRRPERRSPEADVRLVQVHVIR